MGATLALALYLSLGFGTASWANVAPIVDSFTASAGSVLPNAVASLAVNAHDPDCAGTCTTGCGLYIRADLTTWTATGGSFPARNNGTSASPYAATADWQAPAVEGTYTITVSLSDSGTTFGCGGRMTTTASLNIVVSSVINQAPVIESLSAGRTTLYIGEETGLEAAASDPDGDPITYAWSCSLGTVTPGVPGAAVYTAPASAPGIATVTLVVTDDKGASATSQIAISVTSAQAAGALTAGLVAPIRVSSDSYGNLVVADRASGGLLVLNLATNELLARLPLQNVTGVAVDWQDRLLVGTQSGARLLDRSGSFLMDLNPQESIKKVADVAVDAAGQRYAVLYGDSGRVVIFDSSGAKALAFGGNGEGNDRFKGAAALAVGPGGEFFVGDAGPGLVKVFDASGLFLRSFGGRGNEPGKFTQLQGLAIDADGFVYASDSFQSRVTVFNPDDTVREVIGGFGSAQGYFMTPSGLLVLPAFNKLVVCSVNSSSLQIFNFQGATSPPGNNPPDVPMPINPADGAILPHFTPVELEVLNANDPEYQPLSYTFELYFEGAPLVLLNTWQVAEGSGTTLVDATEWTSDAGLYTWRARSFDGELVSAWTADQTFRILGGQPNRPPGVPLPESPAGGAESADLVPFLIAANTADPEGNPITYRFEVALLVDGGYQVVSSSGAVAEGASLTPWQVPAGALAPSQEAYWRCRANDGFLYGNWSAWEVFWTPPFSVPEAGEYGNVPGGDATRPGEVRYEIPPATADTTVYFQVYDIASLDELSVEVNGASSHTISAQLAGSWSFTVALLIPSAELKQDAPNRVVFVHPSLLDPWGVRSVTLAAPPVPSLSARPFNTVVDLAWSTPPGIPLDTVLRIYRAFSPLGPFVLLGDFPPSGGFTRDIALENETTYYYQAVLVDNEGVEGESSPVVSAKPSALYGPTPITDLKAVRYGNDIELTWTPVTSSPPLQQVEIYRDSIGAWAPDTSTFSNLLAITSPFDGRAWVSGGAATPSDQWYSVIPLGYDGVRAQP